MKSLIFILFILFTIIPGAFGAFISPDGKIYFIDDSKQREQREREERLRAMKVNELQTNIKNEYPHNVYGKVACTPSYSIVAAPTVFDSFTHHNNVVVDFSKGVAHISSSDLLSLIEIEDTLRKSGDFSSEKFEGEVRISIGVKIDSQEQAKEVSSRYSIERPLTLEMDIEHLDNTAEYKVISESHSSVPLSNGTFNVGLLSNKGNLRYISLKCDVSLDKQEENVKK